MGFDEKTDTAAAVTDLVSELGLPTKLRELGVAENDIEEAALQSEKDHTSSTNPRKATAQDYRELLRQAF